MIKVALLLGMVLFAHHNTVKTAIRNSRIDFYFVTCFYSLYDICMPYFIFHSAKFAVSFTLKLMPTIVTGLPWFL